MRIYSRWCLSNSHILRYHHCQAAKNNSTRPLRIFCNNLLEIHPFLSVGMSQSACIHAKGSAAISSENSLVCWIISRLWRYCLRLRKCSIAIFWLFLQRSKVSFILQHEKKSLYHKCVCMCEIWRRRWVVTVYEIVLKLKSVYNYSKTSMRRLSRIEVVKIQEVAIKKVLRGFQDDGGYLQQIQYV